jgi:hypothetical protein
MPKEAPIFGSLLWGEIKDEIEPQLFVTLVFIAKLLVGAVRDERSVQATEIKKEIGNYRFGGGKDEIARSGPSP